MWDGMKRILLCLDLDEINPLISGAIDNGQRRGVARLRRADAVDAHIPAAWCDARPERPTGCEDGRRAEPGRE